MAEGLFCCKIGLSCHDSRSLLLYDRSLLLYDRSLLLWSYGSFAVIVGLFCYLLAQRNAWLVSVQSLGLMLRVCVRVCVYHFYRYSNCATHRYSYYYCYSYFRYHTRSSQEGHAWMMMWQKRMMMWHILISDSTQDRLKKAMREWWCDIREWWCDIFLF